jgi:hypothetical protein
VEAVPSWAKKRAVQDTAVGVVQGHYQVLHRHSRDPFMGRGVQMHQHADQRPAFAPASVLTPGRFFVHHSGFLQHQSQPVVGDLDRMLFTDLLEEMAHREVGINLAL